MSRHLWIALLLLLFTSCETAQDKQDKIDALMRSADSARQAAERENHLAWQADSAHRADSSAAAHEWLKVQTMIMEDSINQAEKQR